MKRMLALILVMTAIFLPASAETTFDPAQYTEEELREIDTLIHMHLTKTEEGTVLYDENGIYVEYRGLYLEKGGSGIGVNVLIQNNSGNDLEFLTLSATVNMAMIGFTNGGWTTLRNGTMFMTKIDRNWFLDYSKLAEWGFTTIQSIYFTIRVEEEDRTVHCIIPISLTLDYPIVYPSWVK